MSSLSQVGLETQRFLERGAYVRDGVEVDFSAERDASVAATRLYRPDDLDGLAFPPAPRHATRIEVTPESTLAATRRLGGDVLALNFASARNPGGGWLGGARAQEESLARASALCATLFSQPDYYEANRKHRSTLYTDHLIYSPRVPVFRDDGHALLERPYPVSFVTSPAPNAGALERNEPASLALVEPTLRRRARHVLLVAAEHGHATLVLGAWGCGAFRCSPALVARVFAELLASKEVRGVFAHVVFAILGGRPGQETFEHFQRALAQ